MKTLNVERIQLLLRDFANRRNWERFHSPKNLSMALASEAGELLDVFRWMTDEESVALSPNSKEHQMATEEIADVLIYALRLADRLGIDLERAVDAKIDLNETRYPVDLSRDNATKYNRREL